MEEAPGAEATLGSVPAVAAPDAACVLTQQEIDSLLGFGGGAQQQEEQSGIQRLVSAGPVF